MKNLKSEKGFTIIEVLIVLAIAGLILLVVFLAVPALQRNSRNTQRSNDAAQIAGIVNECLSNRNGVAASCDTAAELAGLDTNKLGILKTVTPTTAGSNIAEPAFPTGTETAVIGYDARCSDDGAGVVDGNDRQFVVIYNTENRSGAAVTRCVES